MKNKKLIALMLSTLIVFTLCMPIFTIAAEQEKFVLRVGYLPDYGISQDSNGVLSGYIYDYMVEIARINHWGLTFIACNWSEGVSKLANGELDVFGCLQKTPDREALFDFPDYPMGSEYGSLFAAESNHEIFYDDLSSIDGKTVCISNANYYTDVLREYCKENGISVTIKFVDDSELQNELLQSGEVDLRVSGNMLTLPDSRIVLNFCNNDFYFPTLKGNRYVLDGLNYALETIQKNDRYYNMRLYDKYYNAAAMRNQAFTQAEQSYINSARPIRVGYVESLTPIEYYDKESDAAKGITIDLLGLVSEYSGLTFEFVPIKSCEQGLQMLKNGALDFCSGFTTSLGFATDNNLVFSSSILNTSLTAILHRNRDLTDTETLVVALPSGWVDVEYYLLQNYPLAQIKHYDTMSDCLNAVLKHEADLTIENSNSAVERLKPYAYSELTIKDMHYSDVGLRFALPLDTAQPLVSILNKSIASISISDVSQAIYANNFSKPYQPSFIEIIKYNSSWISGILIAFFLILLLLSALSRRKLNKIAFYDSLTGEINLNKFKIEAEKILNSTNDPYAIIVIDIDKFKSINDLYGYDFGDKILRFLASQLRELISEDDLLCRGTADRFHIFSQYVTNGQIEKKFFELVRRVETFRFSDTLSCKVILSAGVCITSSDGMNIISVIDRANIASKNVKNSHHSRISFYNQSMYDQINNEKEIENSMAAALAHNEFIVYLQPKTELSSMRTVGAEALVRWLRPQKGMIMPGDFIPLFEKNGFVTDLDYYVFEQTCKLLERWKQENRRLFTISVNLSRRHIKNSDTVQILTDILAKYDVDAKYIELELTESAMVDCDVNSIINLLDELHSFGFTISVDDFGSGYSSLSLLKEIPIDALKIDKSFFSSEENPKAAVVLESVISLSRKMNIKTVSEGVETLEQVDLLVKLGCDLVQGYYFARPMPIDQLEKAVEVQDKQSEKAAQELR